MTEEPTPADLNPADTLEAIPEPRARVEALLFASSAPVKPAKLAEAAEIDHREVERCVRELNEAYESQGRSFHILSVANGFQLMSRPEFFPYIQRLGKTRAAEKLTPAAIETLAIIAYKQPIIRAEIEAIRGVQSGPIVRNLLERKLVCVRGRDERPGHPILYGTTSHFLEVFGLQSIKDLPSLEEFK